MTKVNASIKAVANKIAWLVGWDDMEAIVYKGGRVEAREIGSFGNDEENIVYVISLEKSYWRDGLENAEFEFPLDIDNSSNWSAKHSRSYLQNKHSMRLYLTALS